MSDSETSTAELITRQVQTRMINAILEKNDNPLTSFIHVSTIPTDVYVYGTLLVYDFDISHLQQFFLETPESFQILKKLVSEILAALKDKEITTHPNLGFIFTKLEVESFASVSVRAHYRIDIHNFRDPKAFSPLTSVDYYVSTNAKTDGFIEGWIARSYTDYHITEIK